MRRGRYSRRHSTWIQLPVTGITLWASLQIVLPQMVKAQSLDQLSGALGNGAQQAIVNEATQQAGTAAGGTFAGGAGGAIENQAKGAIGDILSDQLGNWTGSVGNVIGDLFGNTRGSGLGGDLLRTVLMPVQGILMNYLNVYSEQFGNLIRFALGEDLFPDQAGGAGGGAGGMGNLLGGATGSLNIVDFLKLHKSIEEQAGRGGANGDANAQMQQVDRYNINPNTLAQSLKFEADRAQSAAMAAGLLSAEGQAGIQKEMETTTKTLQQIQAYAQNAQGRDVTQDVMKDAANIAANQSALQAGTYSQILALRTQTAADSVVQSNISEALDEMNRRDRAESAAAADLVLRNASQVYIPGSKIKP